MAVRSVRLKRALWRGTGQAKHWAISARRDSHVG